MTGKESSYIHMSDRHFSETAAFIVLIFWCYFW